MRYALVVVMLGGLFHPLGAAEPELPAVPSGQTVPAELSADEAQALLKRKLLELDSLQAEIATLRRLTNSVRQVVLQLQILEIDRTRLAERKAELNLDLSALDSFHDTAAHPQRAISLLESQAARFVNDGDPLLKLLKSLEEQGLVKVLASPNLVTVPGRAASFHAGGEVPSITSDRHGNSLVSPVKFGTEVDFLPTELASSRLKVELRTRISELDHRAEINTTGQKVRIVRVREFETGIEVQSGQTAVIIGTVRTEPRKVAGKRGRDGKAHEIELLVLARAELVDETAAPVDTTAKGYYIPRSR